MESGRRCVLLAGGGCSPSYVGLRGCWGSFKLVEPQAARACHRLLSPVFPRKLASQGSQGHVNKRLKHVLDRTQEGFFNKASSTVSHARTRGTEKERMVFSA